MTFREKEKEIEYFVEDYGDYKEFTRQTWRRDHQKARSLFFRELYQKSCHKY